MAALKKKDFPVDRAREHLETGPIVLVTSRHQRQTNIMTMGWHCILEFEPSLFGCYIWERNRSHDAILASRQCVINVPTVDLVDQVVAIGNTHSDEGDKFADNGLTATKASKVRAPLIAECYANFECRLFDDRMVERYSFFIWKIVKAHVAPVKAPKTFHYRGRGRFMVAGREIDRSRFFKKGSL